MDNPFKKIQKAYVARTMKKAYGIDINEPKPTETKSTAEVLWSGEPVAKQKWTKYEWLFLPLSWFIFFAGLFWMAALKEVTFLHIFAVLLALIGIYCVFFRNHFKKVKRRKYSYEVTTDDITIIYTKRNDMVVRQLPLETVKYVAYSIRKNNIGTIYFNFPNDYVDILRLVFSNSGLGRFDEHIFAFYEIEDANDFLEQLKTRLGEEVIYEKI